jgi:hypothetical protein
MSTTQPFPAAKWFYAAPEKRPYVIAERLRNSLWDLRFGDLWLDTESVESPIVLSGLYNGGPIKLEWEPRVWFRLTVSPDAPHLANAFKILLRFKPALSFVNKDGATVYEWYPQPEAANKRWQEIQGKPAFGAPQRLSM